MNICNDILMLRALEPTDLDVLYRWENDVDLWHTSATITPFSRKQLWDYIENYDGDIFRSRQLRLMIEDVTSKNVIGTIDLYDFDPVNSRANVGILIDKAYQGLGYGAKALSLLEDYCREFIQLHQLVVIIAINNEKSINLFSSLNYLQTGILLDWLNVNGDFCDAHIYQKIIK